MNITVNGINLFYTVTGKGKPILFLHGNSEDHTLFDGMVRVLAKTHAVYLIDSRNHGKSGQTQNLSYDLMADDIIEFIRALEINKPIIFGFSDGGIIGLKIVNKEHNLLDKLIIAGANINTDGIKKRYLNLFKILYFFGKSPVHKLLIEEPGITFESLNTIVTPTVVLAGEKDIIKLQHTLMIHANIKGSLLEIVPNAGHVSYIKKSADLMQIIFKYLD